MQRVFWWTFILITCCFLQGKATCDSMYVSDFSTISAHSKDHKITKFWYAVDNCKQLPTWTSKANQDCAPCAIAYQLNVDTTETNFYFRLDGADHAALSMNGRSIMPTYISPKAYFYHVQLPDTPSVVFEAQIWLNIGDDFTVLSYASNQKTFDYRAARKDAYTGSNRVFQLFLGAVGLLFLINLLWYFLTKRKDIGWYAVYTFLLWSFFFATNILYLEKPGLFVMNFFVLGLQPLFYVAYTLFVIHFLETPTQYPSLHKVLVGASWFFGLSFLIIVLTHGLEWYSIQNTYLDFYRVATGIFAFSVIFYLLKNNSQYAPFIIYGGLFIVIGSLMTLFFSLNQIKWGPFLPIHWMMMGTGIELIIFMAGIGYRTQVMQKDKLKLEKYTAQLSKKELEAELQTLRTQMNPHFIFNSLNSIKSFIAKNERRIAADYLSKFAQLMRLILAHSKEALIPLSKELEAVSIYVSLEQMRFNQKFNFNVKIQDSLDAQNIRIQPLIIQPFVENAIWHGLLHKEKKGSLTLQVFAEDGSLCIVIDDDGIGRMKAKEYAQNRLVKKKSYGMQITADRLKNLYGDKYEIEIIDKIENLIPQGTQIKISLPIKMTKNEYQNSHH